MWLNYAMKVGSNSKSEENGNITEIFNNEIEETANPTEISNSEIGNSANHSSG